MIKGTIEFISNKPDKDYKGIKFIAHGEREGRWFACTPQCISFAKKGEAELDMDADNIVTRITMVSIAHASPTQVYAGSAEGFRKNASFHPPDPERERKIVRQSCLKCAVELAVGSKLSTAEITKVAETFENWVYR